MAISTLNSPIANLNVLGNQRRPSDHMAFFRLSIARKKQYAMPRRLPEAPIGVYSMTTSTHADAPRDMGFQYSLNSLNVATSRAEDIT
jgi:hypothetical protein